MPDISTLLGDPEQIRAQYNDTVFEMLDTDYTVRNYVQPVVYTLPIKMRMLPPAEGSTVSRAVITRGGFFDKKQTLSLRVENDHATYYPGYLMLELLFSKFLENDAAVSETIGEHPLEKAKFTSMFSKINIEMLPELMYWVNHVFTGNIPRWVRFKKLFMAISLSIDPVIIDTIKFKFLQYLLTQRKLIVLHGDANEKPEPGKPLVDHYLDHTPDSQVLHKVMDLYIFMPYAYLFFVYKNMIATVSESDLPKSTNERFKALSGANSLV